MQEDDLKAIEEISKEQDEEDRQRCKAIIDNEALPATQKTKAIDEIQEIDRRNDIRQYLRDAQELDATWRMETAEPKSPTRPEKDSQSGKQNPENQISRPDNS